MIKGKKNIASNSMTGGNFKIAYILNRFSYLVPPGLLVILTSFFYYFSLNYPFQFDDIANITKKFAIRFDNPLAFWWVNSRWFGDWLNRLNFEIGRFDSFWYRGFNLAIHIFAGLLVFYLIKSICQAAQEKLFFKENASLIAFVCAGLFLLHPVQSQTVSYVIQARIEGLATLFALGMIFLFVKIFEQRNVLLQAVLLFVLFVVALISCGTKEIVIVSPILMLLVDWFFISGEQWQSLKTRIWFHAIFSIYFFGLMIHYLSPSFATKAVSLAIDTGNNRGNILTPGAYDIITPLQFLISEFKVILHYLWMFVWPFNISVEYDWKVATTFWQADVIFPLIILSMVLGYAVYSFILKKNSCYAFGIFWFFVCVLPRSSIIPSPELVCDYKTYLAAVGWLFVISTGLVYCFDFLSKRIQSIAQVLSPGQSVVPNALIVFSLILAVFGFGTYGRNQVWESAVAFWEDNIKKAPGKARAYNNYGVALSEAGRLDESITAYLKAIELDKFYSDPLSNIAVAYSLKEDTDKAIEALRSALVLCPNYPEALNNLGTLYIKKKDYPEAERFLLKAIELRPYYGKAYYNMGRLHLEKNQEEVAWGYFKKAVEGDLDNPDGFFTFGQMSIRLKKFEEAARAFELVIQRGCNSEIAWFNLANSYFMLKDYNKAKSIYEKLVAQNPLEGRYLHNLAETHYSLQDYVSALETFKRVTTLAKPMPQSFFRIVNCLENMDKHADAMAYLKQLEMANAPDDFKQLVRNEMARLAMQEKLDKNDNKIKVSEIKQALALRKSKEQKQA